MKKLILPLFFLMVATYGFAQTEADLETQIKTSIEAFKTQKLNDFKTDLETIQKSTDTPEEKVKKLQALLESVQKLQNHEKVLEFNFCELKPNDFSYNALKNFSLSKGDLFSVKINGINPYLYNINVTTKNDTLKTGTPPALFTAFMDVSSLGNMAANIRGLTGSTIVPSKANSLDEFPIQNWTSGSQTSSDDDFTKNKINKYALYDTYKGLSKDNQKKANIYIDFIDLNISNSEKKTEISQSKKKLTDQFPNQEDKDLINAKVETEQQKAEAAQKAKNDIRNSAKTIDDRYGEIIRCYTNSIAKVQDAQLDCSGEIKLTCYDLRDCKCLDLDMEINIEIIEDLKNDLLNTLNDQMLLKTADTNTYSKLITELQSNKYSVVYLNKIFAYAYANFSIANNMQKLSTYYSFPIQAQGDNVEIKIDITPKTQTKPAAKDTTKAKATDTNSNTNTNTNTNSSQQPVTININTASTPTPTTAPSNTATTADGKGGKGTNSTGKTTDTTPKKDSASTQDILAAADLKVVMPTVAREYHLNYKFRTNNLLYGFGAGFFVDWLKDDVYTNKAQYPDSANTKYKVVKENTPSIGKYGIMATVNGGFYLGNSYYFIHFFAGPGLTVETKLQPRLLLGGGFGWGNTNRFSVNGGFSIGQVQRISNAIDTPTTTYNYSLPQTNLYYTKVAAAGFVSINYTFGLK